MTGRRGARVRWTALAVAACSAALSAGWTVAAPSAAAFAHCSVSGRVQGNNPAQVGDPIFVQAFVSGSRCHADTIDFRGGGRTLDEQQVDFPDQTEYDTVVMAFAGLSTITAVLSDGSGAILGAVNVVGATTIPPAPARRTTTIVPPPPPLRSSVTTTTVTTTGATPTRTTSSAQVVPTMHIPNYGGSSTESDSPTPSASDSSSDSAVALPVDIIHGSGSVRLIPSGLLLVMIVVLAGVLGAAVRLVYVYSRAPDHAS